MAALTYAQMISMTDNLAACSLRVKPAVGVTPSNTTTGLGDKTATIGSGTDYGCHKKCDDLRAYLLSLGDEDRIIANQQNFKNMATALSYQTVFAGAFTPVLNGLISDAAAAGVSLSLASVYDINTFATYYNSGAGGPNNCLFCPDFAVLYNTVYSNPLSTLNVYSPAIATMASYNAATTVFTAGTSVTTASYAGVALCQLTVTSFAGTTQTVTITGTNQNAQTGRTWTVSVTGNGTFALTPTVATDLLVSVQSYTVPAGITAGTLVCGGLVPSGRSNPPV